MTTATTPEQMVSPDPADELLCEAARRWLLRRGWRGSCEWIAHAGRSQTDWIFDLGTIDGAVLHLQVDVEPDTEPAPAEKALLQSYLRAAAWLCQDGPDVTLSPGGEWVLANRAEIEKRLHDLNNRLNSLLANTSVLATAHRQGDRLACFAQQAEHDGDACVQAVRSLSAVLLEMRT